MKHTRKLRVGALALAAALCVVASSAPAHARGKGKETVAGVITAGVIGLGMIGTGLGMLAIASSDRSEAQQLSDQLYATPGRSCVTDPRCGEINELLVDSDNFHNAGIGVLIGGAAVTAAGIVLLIKGGVDGDLARVDVRPTVVGRGGTVAVTMSW